MGVCVPRFLCGGQRTIYIELVLFPLHGSLVLNSGHQA